MTATQDPPATKPAAKRSARQDGGEGSTPASKRDYKILRELRLDVTDPASLVDQLQSVSGSDEPVTVFAVVGTGSGVNPKSALTQFGRDNDLDGSYDVVAAKSFAHYDNVKTATKRDVSIG
jgi:hypothetical protein